ncbi:cupin domain-containing protein [Roseibium sp.]|uniref:cupin domain-containing protein n=1 Tax=Roseibium sp. TaxID=1936156 RepID=UPI003BA9BA0E
MSETYYLMGMIMDFHSSSKEDGYFLCSAILSNGAGAPPNRHMNDQESFFVQKGQIEFTVGNETILAGQGQFVKVPRGEVHSFRNTSGEDAEMLILNVPGSIHENVFRTCGTKLAPGSREWPKPEPELDMAWVARVCADEGLEIVG